MQLPTTTHPLLSLTSSKPHINLSLFQMARFTLAFIVASLAAAASAAEISAYIDANPRNTAFRLVVPKDIKVYFQVISTAAGLGNYSDETIAAQIAVMNADFAGNYNFVLTETIRTTNDAWFNSAAPSTAQQTQMKNALRKGTAADLNVYTVGFNSGSGAGLLGYATFPSSYRTAPLDDGVVVLFSSLPGGTTANYNLGRTLTHEVGHWLGLFHTFQGGCTGRGDSVADTPAQASPSSGCPVGRDSCPSCMTDFTPGQYERVAAQLALYRGL
ncbi:hypothetical protein BC829DRAFT_397111 [Chytridium lagenaria]|nr:hypothetical protein BC829DRAFT_397111 [Chytridium lagenaria]